MRCGLLGRKLGHSYSPQIHNLLSDYTYSLFEVEPEELEAFLRDEQFSGINVTIPYKKAVVPYLDELSSRAERLGCVNTVLRRPDGKLIGHNTDYYGFSVMVDCSGLSVAGKKVLVLGSGGASNTAVAVLTDLGACVTVISRSGENNYSNLAKHADAAVIVNTTPVGMYPHNGQSPIDLSLFPCLEGVLDVIYNPARTQLLMDAQSRGLVAVNGLMMLVAQAKESAEWFAGRKISDDRILEIYKLLKTQTENIILIGMPGCGKSTVAKMLAKELSHRAVDADAAVVEASGQAIPQIFKEQGEPGFRAMETEALADLGKQSGLVIATGGGCVTRGENYPLLHQNGTVFWLKRDLSALPTEGRPLSATGQLEEMYRIRKPMYEQFSDYCVDNNGTPQETVQEIIRILEAM